MLCVCVAVYITGLLTFMHCTSYIWESVWICVMRIYMWLTCIRNTENLMAFNPRIDDLECVFVCGGMYECKRTEVRPEKVRFEYVSDVCKWKGLHPCRSNGLDRELARDGDEANERRQEIAHHLRSFG